MTDVDLKGFGLDCLCASLGVCSMSGDVGVLLSGSCKHTLSFERTGSDRAGDGGAQR